MTVTKSVRPDAERSRLAKIADLCAAADNLHYRCEFEYYPKDSMLILVYSERHSDPDAVDVVGNARNVAKDLCAKGIHAFFQENGVKKPRVIVTGIDYSDAVLVGLMLTVPGIFGRPEGLSEIEKMVYSNRLLRFSFSELDHAYVALTFGNSVYAEMPSPKIAQALGQAFDARFDLVEREIRINASVDSLLAIIKDGQHYGLDLNPALSVYLSFRLKGDGISLREMKYGTSGEAYDTSNREVVKLYFGGGGKMEFSDFIEMIKEELGQQRRFNTVIRDLRTSVLDESDLYSYLIHESGNQVKSENSVEIDVVQVQPDRLQAVYRAVKDVLSILTGKK